MSKQKEKLNIGSNAWLLLLIYAMVFLIGGFVAGGVVGEQQGYEAGVRDGVQSTLLINPMNECEVIKYNRGSDAE